MILPHLKLHIQGMVKQPRGRSEEVYGAHMGQPSINNSHLGRVLPPIKIVILGTVYYWLAHSGFEMFLRFVVFLPSALVTVLHRMVYCFSM